MLKTGKAISIDVYIFLAIFLQALTLVSLMDEIEWARNVCNATKEEIGRSNPKDARIVGGQIAFGGVKYQLALNIYSSREKNLYLECGGAPINANWVITAAHCVIKPGTTEILTDIDVIGGTKAVAFDGQKRKVSKVEPYPTFSLSSPVNDIALLKVSEPFNFTDLSHQVQPIDLPTKSTPLEGEASISGFGCSFANPKQCSSNSVLMQVRVPLWSMEKCVKAWTEAAEARKKRNLTDSERTDIDNIHRKLICAGGNHVGSCSGDSGGPLVVMENNRPVVIGVTSFGFKYMCGCDGIPATYTNVISYLDWIKEKTGDKENPTPRSYRASPLEPPPSGDGNHGSGNAALKDLSGNLVYIIWLFMQRIIN